MKKSDKNSVQATDADTSIVAAGDAASPEQAAAGYAANSGSEDSSTGSDIGAIDSVGSISDMVASVVESHDGFDPLLHAVNPDGTPKRKVDGSYAMKRGRKSGVPQSPSSAAPAVASQATITPDEAARQSCNMIINGAVLMFGEQWEPRDKDEAKGLQISFKNYFEARGVPNVPPEVGLIVAVLAYSLPRITHEKTVSRFQTIKLRAFEIFKAVRGK